MYFRALPLLVLPVAIAIPLASADGNFSRLKNTASESAIVLAQTPAPVQAQKPNVNLPKAPAPVTPPPQPKVSVPAKPVVQPVNPNVKAPGSLAQPQVAQPTQKPDASKQPQPSTQPSMIVTKPQDGMKAGPVTSPNPAALPTEKPKPSFVAQPPQPNVSLPPLPPLNLDANNAATRMDTDAQKQALGTQKNMERKVPSWGIGAPEYWWTPNKGWVDQWGNPAPSDFNPREHYLWGKGGWQDRKGNDRDKGKMHEPVPGQEALWWDGQGWVDRKGTRAQTEEDKRYEYVQGKGWVLKNPSEGLPSWGKGPPQYWWTPNMGWVDANGYPAPKDFRPGEHYQRVKGGWEDKQGNTKNKGQQTGPVPGQPNLWWDGTKFVDANGNPPPPFEQPQYKFDKGRGWVDKDGKPKPKSEPQYTFEKGRGWVDKDGNPKASAPGQLMAKDRKPSDPKSNNTFGEITGLQEGSRKENESSPPAYGEIKTPSQ